MKTVVLVQHSPNTVVILQHKCSSCSTLFEQFLFSITVVVIKAPRKSKNRNNFQTCMSVRDTLSRSKIFSILSICYIYDMKAEGKKLKEFERHLSAPGRNTNASTRLIRIRCTSTFGLDTFQFFFFVATTTFQLLSLVCNMIFFSPHLLMHVRPFLFYQMQESALVITFSCLNEAKFGILYGLEEYKLGVRQRTVVAGQ